MTATLAAFKDLCIDAVDPRPLGRFWAETLGSTSGSARTAGAADRADPAANRVDQPVPEPVTVKQRVHLDVHAGSVEEVLARGATSRSDRPRIAGRWSATRRAGSCASSSGTRFRPGRLYEMVVDCADPQSLAAWWADVLGGRPEYDDEHGGRRSRTVPGAPFEYLVFVPVPEPKTVKNRIHWDVDVPDLEPCRAGARCSASATTRSAGRPGRPRGQRVLRVHPLRRQPPSLTCHKWSPHSGRPVRNGRARQPELTVHCVRSDQK